MQIIEKKKCQQNELTRKAKYERLKNNYQKNEFIRRKKCDKLRKN